MLFKSQNTIAARDTLISLAEKLPPKLFMDSKNPDGLFTVPFLLKLTETELKQLAKEVEKQKCNYVFLSFSTVKEGTDKCPVSIRNFSQFNWENVVDLKISGDTVPHQHNVNSEPLHYVSVVFTMK